jgi:peptidoglycan/xylan/chitin deacetylase (PgdA/CDA1 family)
MKWNLLAYLTITGLHCCGAPNAFAEKLAITFDDLPLNGMLESGTNESDLVRSTLAILKARHAPPVFGFINAKKLEANSQGTLALQLWVDGGQRVGNHTYSHADLNRRTIDEFSRDALLNEPSLSRFSPSDDWRWFRYPYLREGDVIEKREGVRAFLRQHRYKIAQTTIDYEDYLWNSPYARCADKRDTQAIARLRQSYLQATIESIETSRRMAEIAFGRPINHVLLLHLGAFTPEILEPLLDVLEEHEFELVTLEEAQSDPIFQTDTKYLGLRGGTLLEQHVKARQLEGAPALSLPRAELEATCR